MSSATEAVKKSTSQQVNGHKRNTSSYAKVAIPLSLSKPKTKAPTAKPTNISKSEVNEVEQKHKDVGSDVHQNGVSEIKQETIRDGDSGDSESKELEASTSSAAPSLGHDSQTSSEDAVRPNTPAVNDSPASNLPTDQQPKSRPASIRTHLPPAFVPSSSSPTSAQPHSTHRHHHQLSQSFRAASRPSSAILSPPLDNTAYPPLRRHHQSAYPPFNHSHNISDTSNASHAFNYQASPGAWHHHSTSQQVQTPQFSNFSPAYRYPPRESFSSVQHPNSVMNFHSDSPTAHTPDMKYPPQDPRYAQSMSSLPHDPRMMAVMPSAPPLIRQIDENLQSLNQHIATFHASQTYADVKLEVVFEQGDSVFISGHKMVFARSQRLHEAMMAAVEAGDGAIVKIQLTGTWISLSAFNDAIEWLYGSVSQRLRSFDLIAGADARNEQLKHILGVIAAGQWLKVFSVSRRALDLVRPLLNWDNLMLAMRFSLEPEASHQANGSNGVAHNPGASQLLNIVLAWMTTEFPPNFYPDTNAAQLSFHQRFLPNDRITNAVKEQSPSESAVTHKTSRSTNDPRLSRIRFGEIDGESPAGTHNSSTSVSTVISSILFSLPFELLKFFLEHVALSEHLGSETVGSITRQVVVERELRRRRALQAYKQQQAGDLVSEKTVDDSTQAQIDNLFIEEVVESDPTSQAGLQLRSRRATEI